MPASHYRFTVNHVEFFAADTNRSMFNIDANVQSDFATWFAASTATWKIVFAHHPYKSNGRHGNAGSYDDLPFIPIVNGANVKSFIEDSVCGKADFYLSGHDHSMEWIQATCTRSGSTINTKLIISGAGASTTDVDRTQPTWFKTDQVGFAYIVIEGNTFTATFFNADGMQLFTKTVTR
jgi:hypothetical protein